jgi:hypothetical protein
LPLSIDLRLVEYHVPGHRRIRLLTNVLDQARLSYDDFSRLTTTPGAAEKLLPGLYHMRWQIEMFHPDYRSSASLYQGGVAA